jgi:hypothetical protein
MKLIIVIAFISLSAISVNSKVCESKTECASDECCATVEGKANECMKYLESGELCDTHAIIKPVNSISIIIKIIYNCLGQLFFCFRTVVVEHPSIALNPLFIRDSIRVKVS